MKAKMSRLQAAPLVPVNIQLGQRVRALRLASPLRKEKICAQLDISNMTLWKIETGHGCRSEVLMGLAEVFGVSLDDLFGQGALDTHALATAAR